MKKKTERENSRGSILMEALLALFIWILIATVLLPSFLYLLDQRKELKIQDQAIQIMTDQYVKWIANEPFDKERQEEEILYQIQTKQETNSTKICVTYKWKGEMKEICREIVEK